MKASVIVPGQTEFGNSVELRFQLEEGRVVIHLNDVPNLTEYVVLDDSSMAQMYDMLGIILRSANGNERTQS